MIKTVLTDGFAAVSAWIARFPMLWMPRLLMSTSGPVVRHSASSPSGGPCSRKKFPAKNGANGDDGGGPEGGGGGGGHRVSDASSTRRRTSMNSPLD